MSGYRQGKSSWCDQNFYPVAERIGQGLNPEAPLLVDVGGGVGHDLRELRTKHPELTGLLVLQDQADVIKQAGQFEKGIEASVHDFFTPQPIKGMAPKSEQSTTSALRRQEMNRLHFLRRQSVLPPFRPSRLGRRIQSPKFSVTSSQP